jgi:hypothetical protein
MSVVLWGRRRILMVLFFCCRLGECPAPGRLLGCGRGPCPTLGKCPVQGTGQCYRWNMRWGQRLIGITLLVLPAAGGTAQAEAEQWIVVRCHERCHNTYTDMREGYCGYSEPSV